MYMTEECFFNYCAPRKYKDITLEDCDKQSVEYIDFAKKWASNPCSIILVGDVGRGKTQFAFAMLREMFRVHDRFRPNKPHWQRSNAPWPMYITTVELDSKLLKASKSEFGDGIELERYSTQELLFIDDIGRETKSDRLKRQYFEILNYRYVNLLPTMLSTNFNLDEIDEILSNAVASRLQEYEMLEFTGPDLRSRI
jgi:DNA replication protein DnaC